MGEQTAQAVPFVFLAGRWVMHRETHFRRARRHAQLVQQADEVRVGPVVVNNETGVHAVASALPIDIHGMGMAADPVVSFEHRNLMLAGQQVGARQSRDTAADDCDAHGSSPFRVT